MNRLEMATVIQFHYTYKTKLAINEDVFRGLVSKIITHFWKHCYVHKY